MQTLHQSISLDSRGRYARLRRLFVTLALLGILWAVPLANRCVAQDKIAAFIEGWIARNEAAISANAAPALAGEAQPGLPAGIDESDPVEADAAGEAEAENAPQPGIGGGKVSTGGGWPSGGGDGGDGSSGGGGGSGSAPAPSPMGEPVFGSPSSGSAAETPPSGELETVSPGDWSKPLPAAAAGGEPFELAPVSHAESGIHIPEEPGHCSGGDTLVTATPEPSFYLVLGSFLAFAVVLKRRMSLTPL